LKRIILFVCLVLVAGAAALAVWLNSKGSPRVAFVEAWPRDGAPNILVVVTDDQRWDQLGLVQAERGQDARYPFLQTPHLDALAQQGMRFRNAFVTTSLCSPSRSTLLTGQFVHSHGVMDNQTPFREQPSWASILRENGYTTAYFGKWHHGMQIERPGFDYVASYRGQGLYHDTPFIVGEEGARNLRQTSGYVDTRTVDYLIEYLEAPRARPFAVMVGLKAVHDPFTPMAEHLGSYKGEKIAVPPNWSNLPSWRTYRKAQHSRPTRRNFWISILESVRGLDANLGRMLDTLEALQLADNTVVIFTSDNGFYLGEFHLGDKRSAYEESMRVPLLVRFPGTVPAGDTSDELVLNNDLAPTILDLAGVAVPDEMSGRSLRPLFSHRTEGWRDAFLYEYWELPPIVSLRPPEEQKKKPAPTPTMLAVRTKEHKLIAYPVDDLDTELYDLQQDPYETQNLAESETHAQVRVELCARLQSLLEETGYSYAFPISYWVANSNYQDIEGSLYGQFDPEAAEFSLANCPGASG